MSKILPVAAAAPAATIGQEFDAVVAGLHARITALESAAVSEETKIATWLKANWLHLVNAGGIAATILKVFGKL